VGYCNLPPQLQQLLYTDPETFDRYLLGGMAGSLSLRSFLYYGFLGFNTSSPAALFKQWQAYQITDPSMALLAATPVLVNAPAWDTLVGNSSRIFWAQLAEQGAIAPPSLLLELDPFRGSGLHCGVGSTANSAQRILSWIKKTLPSP
jgi:hypothetical protein